MPCHSEPWSHDLDCPKGGCVCGREPNLFVGTNLESISVKALKAALKKKLSINRAAARSSKAASERVRLAEKEVSGFLAAAMAAVGKRCDDFKIAVVFDESDNVETMMVAYKNLKSRVRRWLMKCRPVPKSMKWEMKGRVLYSHHTH